MLEWLIPLLLGLAIFLTFVTVVGHGIWVLLAKLLGWGQGHGYDEWATAATLSALPDLAAGARAVSPVWLGCGGRTAAAGGDAGCTPATRWPADRGTDHSRSAPPGCRSPGSATGRPPRESFAIQVICCSGVATDPCHACVTDGGDNACGVCAGGIGQAGARTRWPAGLRRRGCRSRLSSVRISTSSDGRRPLRRLRHSPRSHRYPPRRHRRDSLGSLPSWRKSIFAGVNWSAG